jgi:hypothetical protein
MSNQKSKSQLKKLKINCLFLKNFLKIFSKQTMNKIKKKKYNSLKKVRIIRRLK